MAKTLARPIRRGTPNPHGTGRSDADALFRAALGNRIVKARGRMEMSQSKLSEISGLARTVINGYEKGRRTPGARELGKLCDALRVSPTELIYGPSTSEKWLEADPKQDSVDAAILMQSLNPTERATVMTLLRALFVEKFGDKALAELTLLMPGITKQAKQAVAEGIEGHMMKASVVPERRAAITAIGEQAPATLAEANQEPSPAKKRR